MIQQRLVYLDSSFISRAAEGDTELLSVINNEAKDIIFCFSIVHYVESIPDYDQLDQSDPKNIAAFAGGKRRLTLIDSIKDKIFLVPYHNIWERELKSGLKIENAISRTMSPLFIDELLVDLKSMIKKNAENEIAIEYVNKSNKNLNRHERRKRNNIVSKTKENHIKSLRFTAPELISLFQP